MNNYNKLKKVIQKANPEIDERGIWQLNKSLDNQSDEVKEFLIKLLVE